MLMGTNTLTGVDMLILAMLGNYLFKNTVTFFSLNFDFVLTVCRICQSCDDKLQVPAWLGTFLKKHKKIS